MNIGNRSLNERMKMLACDLHVCSLARGKWKLSEVSFTMLMEAGRLRTKQLKLCVLFFSPVC